MAPDALPLRDLHLPEPISWWPPAPGWWVLAALLAVTGAALAWIWYRWRHRALRRAALAALADIERAYARDGDGHRYAMALSGLVRRIALRYLGSACAALTGEDWLGCLARVGGAPVDATSRAVLIEAPYSRRLAEALPPSSYAAAGAFAAAWLAGLPKPPARPGLGGPESGDVLL
jgi:hypothetical protein